MKKLVALILAMALLCGATSALAQEMIPGYYVPPVMNEGQFPIAEEGVTLTYWAPISGSAINFITDHDGNAAHIVAQEETGVDIQWIHPIVGSEQESFNLLLNSGDLPDMIQMTSDTWYNGGLQAMYDDGIIIDLTHYLDEFAPPVQGGSEHSELGYAQTHDNGMVLGFYKITYADKTPYIFFDTNLAWLEEYGKSEPKTIAEHEAYFDWILENKPGVVPVWFDLTAPLQMDLTMGAFDFVNDWYLVAGEDHVVKYWAEADGYKDWLTLMNQWYNKGYFSRDFLSLTGNEVSAMFDAGKLAVSSAGDAFDIRAFTPTNFPFMRKAEDSVIGSAQASDPVGDGGDYVTVITTACDNVEAAIQYMNCGYTFEGSLPYNFGVEGEAWEWDENNMPVFTELSTNNPDGMTNIDVCWVLHAHFATRYTYPDELTIPTSGEGNDYQAWRSRYSDDQNVQNFLRMPPISLTVEENTERTDIMVQIDTYAQEKMYQFITGAESLDNYDAYLAELQEMGMARATEITQAATDRFYGK